MTMYNPDMQFENVHCYSFALFYVINKFEECFK